MEINQENCVKLLHDQFVSDFSQINNISKVMSSSWWMDRQECFSYYWNSVKSVKDDLKYWMENEEEWSLQIVEETTVPEKTDSKFSASVQSISFDNIDFDNPYTILQTLWVIGKWILIWLAIIILLSIFIRME